MVFNLKKIISVLIVLVIIFLISNQKSEEVIIPQEAIRFRVIANSNSEQDQAEKKKVAKKLAEDVTNLIKDSNSIEEVREKLQSNVNNFSNLVNEQIKEDNYESEVQVNYGNNFFPKKNYKGVVYDEGEYESLVVTLGSGSGENFWCVLFPPLCLLEAEEDSDVSDVKYTSFVKELIDKYF